MSFRQYGGINYAARNNIVKNNFTNASNLSIMNKVGQPDSKINVESTLDVYAINLTSPTYTTNENGVVPKSYVDLISVGLTPLQACQCATTGPLSPPGNPSLTTYSLPLVIDNYTVQNNDRVLIKDQPPNTLPYLGSVENGIYVFNNGTGTFARSSDYSNGTDAYGAYTLVQNGTVNANKQFIELSQGTVGTSALLFTTFSSSFSVGQGLEKISTGSSTTIQVKSNLSSPSFITSLAVSGATSLGSLTVNNATTVGSLTVNNGPIQMTGDINTERQITNVFYQLTDKSSLSTVTGQIYANNGTFFYDNDSSNGQHLFAVDNDINPFYFTATNMTFNTTNFPTCTSSLSLLSPSNSSNSVPTCAWVQSAIGNISGTYATISYVNSTFQTIAGMSSYLTTSSAAATYQTIAGMSSYLTTSAASTTYLTISSASVTYQTLAGMSSYLTTSAASTTYQTLAGMSSYLTISSASTTYQTLADMSNYALLASPTLTGVPRAPTASAGNNSTQIATTAYVDSAAGGGYWTANGANIFNSNTGNVGIGTNTPQKKLEVGNGYDALINGITVGKGNQNSINNTAFGNSTLAANVYSSTPSPGGTGNYNSGFGALTLSTNTTGIYNTAIGASAIAYTTTGSYNTSVGALSLEGVGNGAISYNTAIGYNALQICNANNNTAVGYKAGINILSLTNNSPTNNTLIGYNAGGASGIYLVNCTLLGANSTPSVNTATNEITLGDSAITKLRCQVTTITGLSDIRDKKNIRKLDAGLDFINELNPVRFDWNMRDGSKVDIEECGFIAQHLQEAQINKSITIPNLVSDNNLDKLEASYGTLIPVMVKAIQEMSSTINRLETEINQLKLKNFGGV